MNGCGKPLETTRGIIKFCGDLAIPSKFSNPDDPVEAKLLCVECSSTTTTLEPRRFFFDQDESSHWYLIPESKREWWMAWLAIPEEDSYGEAPDFAQRLDGGVNHISFVKPQGVTIEASTR